MTIPAISWPGTIGNSPRPQSASTWWMSEWQIPQNLMSIATSCSPSARRSIVVASSGAFAEGACRARALVVMA